MWRNVWKSTVTVGLNVFCAYISNDVFNELNRIKIFILKRTDSDGFKNLF